MGNLRSNSEIKPRVIFVAWNFYFDYSNGASITAREILLGLASSGWEVSTLCGPCIDNPEVSDVFKILRSFKVSFREVFRMEKPSSFSVYSFQESGLFSSLFVPRDDSPIPNREVGRLFLDFVADSLQKMKPDIVITYGGFWMASELLRVVRQFGAKSVFLLQNFAYWERDVFSLCDLVVVPSYFARDVYKDRLGIETVVIPPLIQRDKVVFSDENRLDSQQYVLFVNPSLNKGVMLFARIAYEMHKRRPEIPFLIVEGCSTNDDILHRLPLLNGVKNIYKFPATTSPKNFYRFAKLTLVPSFFDESFGRVVIESMASGIPVICSNRGALVETAGDSAILLEVDKKYTPLSREIPSSLDVELWVKSIINLWDDPETYDLWRQKGLQRSAMWDYSSVLQKYKSTLISLLES